MAIISTGTKTLDALFDGGLKTKVVTLLFGIPNLGKTWFCFQMAAMCTRPVKVGGLGKKVLYIDTEGFFFTEDTIERFKNYFKKRWPDCDVNKIEVMQVEDIFRLGDLWGIEFEIIQEDKRVTTVAKFPTDRQKKIAAGKSKKVKHSEKLRDWLERSPIWKKLESKDYGLVIIDSLTIPIKSEIPTSTQNFPARTSLLQILLGACYPLARRLDLAILITNHVTRNPMNPGYHLGLGNPWGGQNVVYYVKHLFGLYSALKDERQKYGPGGERLRRFHRYRYPGLDPDIKTVLLAKDRGYVDLIGQGARPAS